MQKHRGVALFLYLCISTHLLLANERIVSLSPSITEIIFALNKGEEMVATSSYSLYPKEAKKLPVVGGYETPNLERILSFAPTLVVGQNFNSATLESLKRFNIKTLQLNLQRVETIKKSIQILSKELHSTQQGAKLIGAIQDAIIATKNSQKSHSVMIVYGLREDLSHATYIAGHDIFFEDIIEICGHTNAYTLKKRSQPVLGYENIIALNPEQIIILHSLATEPNVNVEKALKNWYSLPTDAARDKKITIVDGDYLHIPSHRVALSIKRLCGVMND